MFLNILILVLVIWFCVLRWQRRKKIQCCNQFRNDFVSLPFVGFAHLLIGNGEDKRKAFQAFGREALKQGGLTSLHCWIFNQFYTVVADPMVAEVVLKNCLEKDDSMKLFGKVFGDSLAVVPVSQWRPRRKTLNPAFAMKHLNQFVGIFKEKSSILAEKLKAKIDKEPFSIYNYIASQSFDVVSESTFGVEANAQHNVGSPVLIALKKCSNLIADRMTQPLFHNESIYEMTSMSTHLKEVADILWNFINKNIKYKEFRRNKEDFIENDINHNSAATTSNSILQLLVEASHGELTEAYLQEEAMILVFAGTDTTSVVMSFTCLLLAKYPDVQEKVFQELQEIFGDSKRPIEPYDLPKLKYTEAVLKESMRIYPPGLILLRKIDKDLVLPSGQTLVKNTGAIINVWAIHRNPEYWGEDAEQFRPERFFDAPPKHPAAFIPFSYGPRNCIGYQFAMMSMKTCLATLVRQFWFTPATHRDVGPHKREHMRTTFDILNRDVDNFPVRLQSRENRI